MNMQQFLSMDVTDQVQWANTEFQSGKYATVSALAETLGMSSSTFGKTFTSGGYVISRAIKQYISKEERSQLGKEEAIKFVIDNYEELTSLITGHSQRRTIASLELADQVIKSRGELITKNVKIPIHVNELFTNLCDEKYSYLKQQDLIAQALYEFVEKYR